MPTSPSSENSPQRSRARLPKLRETHPSDQGLGAPGVAAGQERIAAVWGRALQSEYFPSGERCISRMLQCNARIAAAWGSRFGEKTSRPERGAFGRLVDALSWAILMSVLGGKRTLAVRAL